jgi:hypothetical protein
LLVSQATTRLTLAAEQPVHTAIASWLYGGWCREMQEHVAKLQAELKAAQAAADLEATLREFKGFLDNGETSSSSNSSNSSSSRKEQDQSPACVAPVRKSTCIA